jgi:hypothetical protein
VSLWLFKKGKPCTVTGTGLINVGSDYLSRLQTTIGLGIGMLYVPYDGIAAEILFIRPHDAMMSGTNEAKIRLIFQFRKSTAA